MDDWIDVTKELPMEDGMLVVILILHHEQPVWEAEWDATYQNFPVSNIGWFERDEVTHWKPRSIGVVAQ